MFAQDDQEEEEEEKEVELTTSGIELASCQMQE